MIASLRPRLRLRKARLRAAIELLASFILIAGANFLIVWCIPSLQPNAFFSTFFAAPFYGIAGALITRRLNSTKGKLWQDLRQHGFAICPECEHDLAGTDLILPCSECGVVTKPHFREARWRQIVKPASN